MPLDLIKLNYVFDKISKHPKCAGYVTNTRDGMDYGCNYNTTLMCEDCKYGAGLKDPEAKCNQGE